MLSLSWSCTFALVALAGCAASSSSRYRGFVAEARPDPVVERDAPVFAGATELERRALIDAVLARNPDLAAARAAWRQALARYPQETALDDPMVSYAIAPLSIGGDAPFGQRIEIGQRFPIGGQRGLAGDVALAEAEAMRGDVDAARLRLAGMASDLFDDYYVAERAIAISDQHRVLLQQMRASAEAQYTAARASQQDPLQADVELARLDRDRLSLDAERRTIVARINGLLHRDPGAELPPPPTSLELPGGAEPERTAIAAEAARARPELAVQAARIRRGEAARRLAGRAGWPDLSVMASYDSMWDMPEHRWMIGVGIEIPLWRGRRAGARAEAEAETARATLERERIADDVRVEVDVAITRLAEARAAVALYDERLVPLARAQVDAARAGYVANQNDLQALIAAQRGLRDAQLERERAVADVHRRLAELDRAAGRLPGGAR